MPASHRPVPRHLSGMLEDPAALGPSSLEKAVATHREHRDAWYRDLVGPLVVGDDGVAELSGLASAGSTTRDGPLAVVVSVSGGAGALAPAVSWATRDGTLGLHGLRIAVRESDAGDLAPNARRIVTAVDALVASGELDDEVPVYVEPPRLSGPEPSASWLAAVDEVAALDHRLTLRTGPAGDGVGDRPSSWQLAACIGAALDRELRFTCSGLLHRALRQPPDRHGFLNVLLATRASLDGASTAEVAAVLDETDARALTARTDEAGLVSARRWFTSFETADVAASVRDLVEVGWLDEPPHGLSAGDPAGG